MTKTRIKDGEPIYKAYYNSKGEEIKAPESQVNETDTCKDTIDFCCIAPIPEGFVLSSSINPQLTNACFNTSELSCCLEKKTVECEVDDPCNGILTCPVDIQSVRLVGTLRITANIGPILSLDEEFGGNCTANCFTAVNVDQIIAFTCNQKIPCVPCFKPVYILVIFIPIIDACGRPAVQIVGEVRVEFVGCEGVVIASQENPYE